VFALATLGGYLLSLWAGLFGFTEVRTTPGIGAGMIEVAAFAARRCPTPGGRPCLPSRVMTGQPGRTAGRPGQ